MHTTTQQVVQRWMTERHLPGIAIAVVQHGRVIHARGFGVSDISGRHRVTPETPFQIASITKALTAVGVMRLVETGQLSLDDTVSTHLPALPAAWRAVTVRHLLGHTSGIASISAFDRPPCNAEKAPSDYARGDVLREVACLPLEFAPGERWEYGDTGYYVLGLLLTAMSGRSYEAFMTAQVFEPAGMRDSRVQQRPPLRGVAEPVRWRNGAYEPVEPFDPMVDEANGAIVSTVLDLARWDAALDANRLVSAATLTQMWRPVAVRTGDAPYGLGFGLTPFGRHRRVGHTGGGPGSATAFAKFPDAGLTVIVLARGELPPGTMQRFANEIAAGYLP
ncbi:serine hydrolase domain-containing protein [Gemmatimonas sp.]